MAASAAGRRGPRTISETSATSTASESTPLPTLRRPAAAAAASAAAEHRPTLATAWETSPSSSSTTARLSSAAPRSPTSTSAAGSGSAAATRTAATTPLEHRDLDGGAPPPRRFFTEDDYVLAATLAADAQLGARSVHADDPALVRSYRLYHRWWWRLLLQVCVAVVLLLALFEKPNGNLNMELPVAATLAVEALCIVVFIVRLGHLRRITVPDVFWRDRKNIALVIVLGAMIIDMAMHSGFHAIGGESVRWSRALRPLFLGLFSDFRQVRHGFRCVRRTMPDVINVVVLLQLTIALFALLLFSLFRDKALSTVMKDDIYMDNYADAYFDLYVLMTTANFPDVMMPAYSSNEWYCLIFVVFLTLTVYTFLSILLAVVYDGYRSHLRNEVRMSLRSRKANLVRIFQLLSDGGVLRREQWNGLMVHMLPKSKHSHIDVLWSIIDMEKNHCVDERRFMIFVNLLNLTIEPVYTGLNEFERCMPTVYNSSLSVLLRTMVKHRYFGYFFDLVILANAIFIGLAFESPEHVLLPLYNVEVFLKLYTYGLRTFVASSWNCFDTVVILAGTLLAILELEGFTHGSTLDFVLVLRVLRLVKVIGNVKRFKVIISTVLKLGPAIGTYGAMLMAVYYFFAIIGMEVFGGLVYDGDPSLNGTVFDPNTPFYNDIHAKNPRLEGSEYAELGYYKNNFNDITSSMIVLFELMIVNQWHVIAAGFVTLTSKYSRIFFIFYHMTTVVVFLNIFIAFVLEAFLLQLQLVTHPEQDEFSETVRAHLAILEIPAGRKYKVGTKVKRADTVYFRMFREEAHAELGDPGAMLAASKGQSAVVVSSDEEADGDIEALLNHVVAADTSVYDDPSTSDDSLMYDMALHNLESTA